MMTELFKDKVALVTGAGSGIGRACALAFANRGAKVVAADVSIQGGKETIRLIDEMEGTGMFFQCDVGNPHAVEELINKTLKSFGQLDFACNNAGIQGVRVPTVEYPLEAWNNVIYTNLTGIWLSMKFEIAQMLEQGSGVIVNMSSILGKVGFANASAYVAANHGILGLTKTAAIEYANQGLRVNAVCPGFIYTPMLQRTGIEEDSDLYHIVAGLHPIKRMGNPEEIANAVMWLCSSEASFVTGEALVVDGGYTAQ
jgi:NAD(P)-dependent dehydrogenase (short-subunit alcohol dehydrogenase family)